ncbi:hypothetical protein ABZP36_013017 [Zizania latifolia]
MAGDHHVLQLAALVAMGVLAFAGAEKYKPTESILVNCGADKEGQDIDGRKWLPDKDGTWLVDGGKSSVMANAESQDPSLPSPVPYMTARVFTKETAYKFSVGEERHWVRLHFYPAAYHGLPAENFFFSVSTSTGVTLLRNFSVYITAKALSQAYIVREFTLPPSTSGSLSLTFTPTAMNNASYAFINGIEIISMPNIFSAAAASVDMAGSEVSTTDSSMQTMYRLNVGGSYVAPINDSGLSRDWYDDTPYIYGAAVGVTFQANDTVQIKYPKNDPDAEYAAPASVYLNSRSMGPDPKVNQNYKLTWVFEVDGKFTYIIRLHFCELLLSKTNQRVFDIMINNKTAQSAADVVAWGGQNVPVYKDYAAIMPDGPGDKVLWIQLFPAVGSGSEFFDTILNGLEIFKMSDTSGNLAGPNPDPSKMLVEAELLAQGKFATKPSNLNAIVIGGAAGGAAAFGIIAAICVVAYHTKKSRALNSSASHSSGWLPVYGGNSHTSASKSSGGKSAVLNPNITAMCRHFSFAEIKSATKNFDESLVIGVGGFGKVYRGVVDGDTKVAIKRSNPSSEQGVLEFQTEIEMLSKLRHKHLDIIDPTVNGTIAPDCLKKFSETAEKCLADHGVDRPSMGDVLWNLEFALQMQETFENGGKTDDADSMSSSSATSAASSMLAANVAALELISEDMDEEDIANSVVFSQLVHPTGR